MRTEEEALRQMVAHGKNYCPFPCSDCLFFLGLADVMTDKIRFWCKLALPTRRMGGDTVETAKEELCRRNLEAVLW